MPCCNRNGATTFVADVCPMYDIHNNRICHLNGCGDILRTLIKTKYFIPLLSLVIVVAVLLTVGLIFILQLTHNFRTDAQTDLQIIKETFLELRGKVRKGCSYPRIWWKTLRDRWQL